MPFPNNIDVIVHIGAGRCEELPTYLATSAKRIILVEPNARLAAELRARYDNESRISVLEVAVSDSPADNELKEYNLADANGLYTPTGLVKLFPGIRILAQQAVTTITGETLLKQCALKGDQNVLVIQAPGAELGIIESLTEDGGIDQFCYLTLTCAETPLYATPSESAAVLKVLQEQGFDLVHLDKTDPDWPIWTLHHNTLKHKYADLTVKYQKVSEQLKHVQKELAAEREKNEDPSSAIFRLEREIDVYKDSLSRTKKELSSTREETTKLTAELAKFKQNEAGSKTTSYSGDAQIDEFLSDLAPFFYNKQITYVDIGAYTGEVFQKISESDYITLREAHLFEPNPASYKKLKARIERMGRPHSVHANNIALGEKESKANFIAADAMTKMAGAESLASHGTETFQCAVKPFAQLLDCITDRHIHLLKIDVEGAELKVLAGAKAVLEAQAIDVIYIEAGFNAQGTQQTYIADLDRFLQSCDYRAFKIYEQKNEWIEDLPWLRRCNIAYMSRRFAEASPYKLTAELVRLKNEVKRLRG